ncbi:uncharacterized protein LOC125518445 [Triticum urartu]|uniref:uncharacterized protein LOC125518445 n=1 Tax=Triticum urartu TaxID=4572 RepID=UPI002044684A|nr:uncharacterized protein LOC125518445 [Triticum urartu]
MWKRDTGAEGFISSLRNQDEVDAVCEKYDVPKEFTARPAGDRRANSTTTPRTICMYASALKAGKPVPLDRFFREVLAHFGIAPAQLKPNGWRIMSGFLALCHSAGVPLSLTVFWHFFLLSVTTHKHRKGWYFFRHRVGSGLRFTGMPSPNSIAIKDWKREFFFLSSPEPWPCSVEWGEPSRSALMKPVLTTQESKLAAKLLRVHGSVAVNLRTYLCNGRLAAAPSPPMPPPFTPTTPSSKGMDPTVHDMMKTTPTDKMAAQASASAKKRTWEEANGGEEVPPLSVLSSVRSPPPQHFSSKHGGNTLKAARELLGRKKRTRQETNAEVELSTLPALNTPLSRVCSPPPGFPNRLYGGTTGRDAARELPQGAVSPRPEPSGLAASSYAALQQVCKQLRC